MYIHGPFFDISSFHSSCQVFALNIFKPSGLYLSNFDSSLILVYLHSFAVHSRCRMPIMHAVCIDHKCRQIRIQVSGIQGSETPKDCGIDRVVDSTSTAVHQSKFFFFRAMKGDFGPEFERFRPLLKIDCPM